jgi:hypothetical protein
MDSCANALYHTAGELAAIVPMDLCTYAPDQSFPLFLCLVALVVFVMSYFKSKQYVIETKSLLIKGLNYTHFRLTGRNTVIVLSVLIPSPSNSNIGRKEKLLKIWGSSPRSERSKLFLSFFFSFSNSSYKTAYLCF